MTSPQNPLKADTTFQLQKWIELGRFSQVDNFWFSSHNFGEVAVIKKNQWLQLIGAIALQYCNVCKHKTSLLVIDDFFDK